MANIPKCPNPDCSRSQTKIIKEHQDFVTVACLTCGNIHVLSSETAKARAKHETRQERAERQVQVERALRRRRKIFA